MQTITKLEELNNHCQNNTFVLLYFSSPTCPPCKHLTPFIEAICENFPQITFLKINCHSENEIAPHFEIGAVPVTIYIKNDEVAGKVLGGDKEEIMSTIGKSFGIKRLMR